MWHQRCSAGYKPPRSAGKIRKSRRFAAQPVRYGAYKVASLSLSSICVRSTAVSRQAVLYSSFHLGRKTPPPKQSSQPCRAATSPKLSQVTVDTLLSSHNDQTDDYLSTGPSGHRNAPTFPMLPSLAQSSGRSIPRVMLL